MAARQQPTHRLFQKLDRQLGKVASQPLPENVHQFRTATRRVEAILEELAPEPDRNHRKLLKMLSRLRKRAGRLRDLDVQTAALRSLRVSEEPQRKAEVLRTLSDMRSKREKKLLNALDLETVREVRKRLKRADAELKIPENGPDPLLLASRIFATLARQQGPLTEEVLHQYRITGKRVRYIAELAGDSPEAQQMVSQLKRMQDSLGEWHDWLTLAATVKKQVGSGTNSALLSAVNNIMRAKFRDALQTVTQTKAALQGKPVAPVRLAATTGAASGRKPVTSQGGAKAAIA
ncbi:MAG TPA: CHAD domain-containing protein [Terriglobales bacterium]|nr:CHAD domain-containing protein [Terriglobales bacterium]